MPDLPSVTTFINSPPGVVVAGAALAGFIYKFFERLEAVLPGTTRHEIARWLRVKNVETGLIVEKVEPWPETFIKLFERLFGRKHLSWKCVGRSTVISVFLFGAAQAYEYLTGRLTLSVRWDAPVLYPPIFGTRLHLETPRPLLLLFLVVGVVGDYFSLLVTRYCLRVIKSQRRAMMATGLLFDGVFTSIIAAVIMLINYELLADWYFIQGNNPYNFQWSWMIPVIFIQMRNPLEVVRSIRFTRLMIFFRPSDFILMWVLPAFSTFAWTLLYAGSGYILKFARRFDLGFDLFNRKLDIETKPLSAIGLVAGSLVALAYWAWAAFRYFHSA